jgi:hypothetical protein
VDSGQVASIASGMPVSPPQHTISTSRTPRLRSSAHGLGQVPDRRQYPPVIDAAQAAGRTVPGGCRQA